METKIQFHQDAAVLTANGQEVGSLERVVFSQESGMITNIVVSSGSLLNKVEKVLPIDLVAEDRPELACQLGMIPKLGIGVNEAERVFSRRYQELEIPEDVGELQVFHTRLPGPEHRSLSPYLQVLLGELYGPALGTPDRTIIRRILENSASDGPNSLEAVVDAIEHDRAEITVAPLRQRLLSRGAERVAIANASRLLEQLP